MAEAPKDNEMFVFMGYGTMRAPDGTPLPAVPLYTKVDKSQVNKKTKLSEGEQEFCEDIGRVFAHKFKQYVDGLKEAGLDGGVSL